MKAKSILFKYLLYLVFSLAALCPAAISKANSVNYNTIGLDIGFLWAGANSVEEPVYFADANLKAAVEDALGVTNPTPADMLELTNLDASRKGITDLTGIENATNLQTLYLRENQVRDISPLSELERLEGLILTQNQVSDISPLSELKSLLFLYLDKNLISDIDALSALTNLSSIRLESNQINDISPLSGLASLQRLYLSDNQISNISSLSGLTNLLLLVLNNNQINDISPLSGLIDIESLGLNNNQISDISPLSGLININTLRLRNNRISDISQLSGLISLQYLDIRTNPLDSDAYNIYIPLLESYGTDVHCNSPVWRTLTVGSTSGGSVIEPGEGDFDYVNGTIVDVHAVADQGYYFVEWTGTAVDAGKVANPYSAVTTLTMDADYTLSANFMPIEVTLIYVDDDAIGTNDGTSWENAYLCLKDALTEAETAERPTEIHVAQGIYRPDQRAMIRQGHLRIVSSGDWTATFQLIDGATIKGGYAGLGEPDSDARDIEQYETILSGDLNADDNLEFTNIWDNSFHVVTAGGTQWMAVLDGFTIAGGNADGPFPYDNGGGMYNVEGSPTLVNCTFSGNSTTGNGGGMYNNSYSSPVLINCIFTENLAEKDGGGMYNKKSYPILTNCNFINNSAFAEDRAAYGGGLCNDEDASPIITNCTFSGNYAIHGGGVSNKNNSGPIFFDCTFSDNTAEAAGGGMHNSNCTMLISHCIFSANYANISAGMLNLRVSESLITNCIISGNSGIGITNNESNLTIDKCTITGNSKNLSAGIYNTFDSEVFIRNCIIWGNIATRSEQMCVYKGARVWVDYCNIQNGINRIETSLGTLVWGIGNIDVDPFFANPGYWDPNGTMDDPNDDFWVNGDYHLKSEFGRWNPISGVLVFDDVTSQCINAGDPNSPVGDELQPNGGRINMGAYGGTPEASLSPRQSLPLLSKASNPNPPDGAIDISPGVILSWSPGDNAVSHDVYFGFTNPPEFVRNQIETEFDPPDVLYPLQKYYWRIDEIDNQGNIIPGDTWTFTVMRYKGRACFAGETHIWIDGAAIPISEVTTGQNIRYLNISGKVETVQEHEGTFVCYDILLESGNCITVAENHYFMSETGKWLSLHDLKEGKRLKTSKGSVGIRSITKQPKPYIGKVYNLKIKDSDQYLVGEDAVIVRDY